MSYKCHNADFFPEPTVESGKITFKLIHTFFDFPLARSDSPSKPVAKRAKHGDGSSTVETSSSMRVMSMPFINFNSF